MTIKKLAYIPMWDGTEEGHVTLKSDLSKTHFMITTDTDYLIGIPVGTVYLHDRGRYWKGQILNQELTSTAMGEIEDGVPEIFKEEAQRQFERIILASILQ